MGNPYQSFKLIDAGSTVGNTLAAGLVSNKVNIQRAETVEAFIKITTVGSMTDLRVRAYVSDKEAPAAFTAGGNADWAPLPVASIAGGVATMSQFEAAFVAGTWFPSDGKSIVVPMEAHGVWLIVVLYDSAGNGAGSSVEGRVYPRMAV